jgi:hypothetical protein
MSLPGKYKVEKLLNWVLPKRNWPSNFQLVGRSTWFTMSRECTEYILKFVSENKKFLKCFKLSWGADELFFQTILFNSPLRPKLINNNLRYIDWSEGKPNPKLLSENDIHKIEVSVCFFARKFNEEDKVLDYLDKRL